MAEVMTIRSRQGKANIVVHIMDDCYRDASPEEIQRRRKVFDDTVKQLMRPYVGKLNERDRTVKT